MIYLNKVEEPNIVINQDLVIEYKEEGDIYLVNVKRNMSKQTVGYTHYQTLQKINNSFYFIIQGLLEDKFENVTKLKDAYRKLVVNCNTLIKNISNLLPDNIYNAICEDIDSLQLMMEKLIYIVENFCFVEDK